MQSLEKAMAELDHQEHMPEGLDEHVWQRLVQARRMKVESEQKVGDTFGASSGKLNLRSRSYTSNCIFVLGKGKSLSFG